MIAGKKPSFDSKSSFDWNGSNVTLFGSYEELEPGVYSVDGNYDQRFRIEKFTTYVPLIIDEFKELFGLPKVGRHRVEYLDGTVFLMVRELGSEYNLKTIEGFKRHYELDILKNRLFRWIFGLPTQFVSKDMFVRDYHGVVEVVSRNDEKLDFSRSDPAFVKNLIEPTIKSMLYGHSLSSLRARLNEIIRRIDPSLIWITGDVISRLSSYGFLTDDD